MQSEALLIPRLVVASVYGAVIGWDRWRHHKPAGLRTHALVALGSATLTAMAQLLGHQGSEVGDVGRVVQGVLAGIGFIGAGTILRQGATVVGLTTAGTVWVSAALGVVVGAGYYLLSGTALVLSFLIVDIGSRLERHLGQVEMPEDTDELVRDLAQRDAVIAVLTRKNAELERLNRSGEPPTSDPGHRSADST